MWFFVYNTEASCHVHSISNKDGQRNEPWSLYVIRPLACLFEREGLTRALEDARSQPR